MLSQFVKRILESYKIRDAETEINIEKQKGESISSSPLWAELEEQILLHVDPHDKLWPCEVQDAEAESYPYPYLIDGSSWTSDWKPKDSK